MELVNVFRGGVAVRLPMDGYTPDIEPPIQSVIEAVGTRYQFAGWPTSQTPLQPSNNTLVFQNGAFASGGKVARIHTLYIEPVGAYLDSSNTDIAEGAILDLASFLDNELGYKFHAVTGKFSFTSVLVVKFDKSLDGIVGPKKEILDAVGKYNGDRTPFTFRKMDFISGDLPRSVVISQVDSAESTVFSLERRVGFANEENVYFSVAPLKTEQHIDVLTEIEKVL